ncbi:MAG: cell envelope integrity EipB family protein [Hyphomicrobiaceae bacterium]|nr:cell envelope integrity EipB family protein [Hyphomicrobiaceae bacterium]MCC0011412.1 cell envelope integrity EipB family protein [Hyphomicrobiaceae bacterium]
MRPVCASWLVTAFIALACTGVSTPALAAVPAPAAPPVLFAPHKAVYDITLERAMSGSGVVELVGRMVYELDGSRCEGYTQNMRFVTRITSQDGSEQLNDLRTSTWEDGQGKRLRFNSEQFSDSQLTDSTAGDAKRPDDGGPIVVTLSKPTKSELTIDPSNLFPMQHSTALLKAAERGQTRFSVGLYDGSEKGEKVYRTNSYIGAKALGSQLGPDIVPGLADIPSWPVSIAYFEPGSEAKDSLPSYELSFRLFANGVSSDMLIDYGEFAVRGELKELTFYARSVCQNGKHGVEKPIVKPVPHP